MVEAVAHSWCAMKSTSLALALQPGRVIVPLARPPLIRPSSDGPAWWTENRPLLLTGMGDGYLKVETFLPVQRTLALKFVIFLEP